MTFVPEGSESLEQRGSDGRWRTLCDRTCKVPATGVAYRVTGNGLFTSNEVVLVGSGAFRLRADMGQQATRTGGAIIATMGGVLAFFGLLHGITLYDDNPESTRNARKARTQPVSACSMRGA